ncbi:hypothetical protein V1514DRAFT_367176 [Lipomyces japonicus]|uniref:uncharacterized protein n=1 Tax=Lipomyces japonicus TaxID=56871 RepID=UPI0034CEE931
MAWLLSKLQFWKSGVSASEQEPSVKVVTSVDYRQALADPDLITYFEHATPSIRRKLILDSSTAAGLSADTANALLDRRNFQIKPVHDDDRAKAINAGAEKNCARLFLYNDNQPQQQQQYNQCLTAQMKLLYNLGYLVSTGNSALDTDIRNHANNLYQSNYSQLLDSV